MDEIIKVLEVLAGNLEGSMTTAIVILLLAFMFIFKKDIPIWINRAVTIKHRLTAKSLEHHDIFTTCTRVHKEVSLMRFYTHGEFDVTKSKMCVDFTKHKVTECQKGFREILKLNVESMSVDEFKSDIMERQNQMHINYVNSIVEEWRSKGIPEADIGYIIKMFETFRYDVVKAFEYRINSIFGSVSHKNNTRRLLAVFEMWAFGIDMLPRDMQVTFETLNGKFKELDY